MEDDKSNTEAPLDWVDRELAELERAGLRRRLSTREGPAGASISVGGRRLISFGSNDYLALAGDRRLVAAAAAVADREGWAAGASPVVCGRSAAHAQLEERLARFEGTEAALVFPSGFAANAGTIAALVGPGDVVYTDRKNHASLLDGCRLSRADVRTYPHGDWRRLGEMLERSAAKYRRRLIASDSLFSMDGDLAPVERLVEVAERYEAMLMIDEAHATGVFGAGGRGVAEEAGVERRVPIRVGTLSKALGSIGGFVAGSRTLIDWLLNRARPYVFSTASPPSAAAAASAAIDIVCSEPKRRRLLLRRAAELRGALVQQGWSVGHSASQIIPVVVGEPDRAVALAVALGTRGFFVPAIRPPTVPEGESCLRISLTSGHGPEMIDALVEALGALRDQRSP